MTFKVPDGVSQVDALKALWGCSRPSEDFDGLPEGSRYAQEAAAWADMDAVALRLAANPRVGHFGGRCIGVDMSRYPNLDLMFYREQCEARASYGELFYGACLEKANAQIAIAQSEFAQQQQAVSQRVQDLASRWTAATRTNRAFRLGAGGQQPAEVMDLNARRRQLQLPAEFEQECMFSLRDMERELEAIPGRHEFGKRFDILHRRWDGAETFADRSAVKRDLLALEREAGLDTESLRDTLRDIDKRLQQREVAAQPVKKSGEVIDLTARRRQLAAPGVDAAKGEGPCKLFDIATARRDQLGQRLVALHEQLIAAGSRTDRRAILRAINALGREMERDRKMLKGELPVDTTPPQETRAQGVKELGQGMRIVQALRIGGVVGVTLAAGPLLAEPALRRLPSAGEIGRDLGSDDPLLQRCAEHNARARALALAVALPSRAVGAVTQLAKNTFRRLVAVQPPAGDGAPDLQDLYPDI